MHPARASFPEHTYGGGGLRSAIPAMTIRPASISDSSAIASLLGELGYPAAPEDIGPRLDALAEFGAIALVAELNGEICGVITAHILPSIHAPTPVAWLTTLVVGVDHQGKGVGRELTAAVEEWARKRGAVRMAVTSGLQRSGAHAFYERLGYARTGLRLTKPLV